MDFLPKEESPMEEIKENLLAIHGALYAGMVLYSSNMMTVSLMLLRRGDSALAQAIIECLAAMNRQIADELGWDLKKFSTDIYSFQDASRAESAEMKRREEKS